MKSGTYYDDLGLDKNANTNDIVAKYLELIKSESISDEDRLKISKVHSTLSDVETREKYNKKLVKAEFDLKYKAAESEFNTILLDLKKEINKIKNITVNDIETKNLHNHFVKSLDALYEEATDNLSYYIHKIERKKSKLLIWNDHPNSDEYQIKINSIRAKSIAALISEDVSPSLKKLKFTTSSKNNDSKILDELLKKCVIKCEEFPCAAQFFKILTVICLTGLGFIAGAIVGFIAGNASMPVIGSLAAIPASVAFASDAYQYSLDYMKIPKINFKHSLLFKTPGYSSVSNMSQSGKVFINPDLINESISSEDDDDIYRKYADERDSEYMRTQTPFLAII